MFSSYMDAAQIGQCTFGPLHFPANWIGKNSLEKSDFNIQFVQHWISDE